MANLRYVVTQNRTTGWWAVIDTEYTAANMAFFHGSLPNVEHEAKALCDRLNQIDGAPRDFSSAEVRKMFHHINHKLSEIQKEVRKNMSGESKLDQALDGLETAATNKLAEDQIVDGLAAQAQDETAETARVQAVADELNKETAAETAQVAAQTPPAPAPATPAPAAPAAGSTTTGS